MPNTQMTLKVEIPTWDDLSDPVKSLLNFFMENASLFFTKEDGGSTYFGNIRETQRTAHSDVWSDTYLDRINLNIPFCNSASLTYTKTLNNLPIVSTPNLLKITSAINVLYYNDNGYSEYDLTSADVQPLAGIGVTLTPLVNGVESTDATLKPVIPELFAGSDIYVSKMNVNLPQGATIDYQLRTSSFRIIDNNLSDTHYDVFYKIGICPFTRRWKYDLSSSITNNLDTIELIKAYLMDGGNGLFTMCEGGSAYTPGGMYYAIGVDAESATGGYNTFSQEHSFLGENFSHLMTNCIIPICNYNNNDYNHYAVGLVYIKLFNQDGTIFQNDLSTYLTFQIKEVETDPWSDIERGDWPEYLMGLNIVDTNMDGGFVGASQIVDE